jgi:hypothetical protein
VAAGREKRGGEETGHCARWVRCCGGFSAKRQGHFCKTVILSNIAFFALFREDKLDGALILNKLEGVFAKYAVTRVRP